MLLRGAPEVASGFLGPLVTALADPGRAAATAVTARALDEPAVAAHAIAVRRTDVPALPAAPAGLEIAALCAQARPSRQRRSNRARSAVGAPGARTGGCRRAPGEAVELTIVIPTLDAAGDRVRRCIAAAQATTEAPHEIVVVDNGAPPQGFTAPVNAGLRAARGRYAVVLNDDVELLPGWWPPLRAALDAGAAVAFPLTIDGAMRTDFAAWCFALSRETLDEFAVAEGEFLDPELVVWYQDTDLLQRLRAGRTPAGARRGIDDPPRPVGDRRQRGSRPARVDRRPPGPRRSGRLERKHGTAAGRRRRRRDPTGPASRRHGPPEELVGRDGGGLASAPHQACRMPTVQAAGRRRHLERSSLHQASRRPTAPGPVRRQPGGRR